jgi:hypothetical protein
MTVTRDKDPKAAEPVGGKVLGLSYRLAEDVIELKVPMQFKLKGRKGQKKVVELGVGELERTRRGEKPLCKREVLSFVMGAFDPLGSIGPARLQGKLLLRRLYGKGSPALDEDLFKEEWRLLVRWLMKLEEEAGVTMIRCVRLEGAIGEPSLAEFSDASASAMCAVVYVVCYATPTRKQG